MLAWQAGIAETAGGKGSKSLARVQVQKGSQGFVGSHLCDASIVQVGGVKRVEGQAVEGGGVEDATLLGGGGGGDGQPGGESAGQDGGETHFDSGARSTAQVVDCSKKERRTQSTAEREVRIHRMAHSMC